MTNALLAGALLVWVAALAFVTVTCKRARARKQQRARADAQASRTGARAHGHPAPPDPEKHERHEELAARDAGACGGAADGGAAPRLDPIMDPRYNMEQIAKQCVLLEEHLNCPAKRCKDCIKKHMLHISGLAEEAVSLCKEDDPFMQELPAKCNQVFADWRTSSKSHEDCARDLRLIRKDIMSQYV